MARMYLVCTNLSLCCAAQGLIDNAWLCVEIHVYSLPEWYLLKLAECRLRQYQKDHGGAGPLESEVDSWHLLAVVHHANFFLALVLHFLLTNDESGRWKSFLFEITGGGGSYFNLHI